MRVKQISWVFPPIQFRKPQIDERLSNPRKEVLSRNKICAMGARIVFSETTQHKCDNGCENPEDSSANNKSIAMYFSITGRL